MTQQPAHLRTSAEALASPLPPLLAEAERLANSVFVGTHGRRRIGSGEEFWQFRAAHPGDSARAIDWRRSAQSDQHFVREKEWQTAQTLWLWADRGQSMGFRSDKNLPRKAERANLLVLATALLLTRAGERVGLAGPDALPPGAGEIQVTRIARTLAAGQSAGKAADFGWPELEGARAHGSVLLISDFLAPLEVLSQQVQAAAARNVRGALVQVLDPQEQSFPFTGRTIFQSMGGTLEHETRKANDLRTAYLDRLATRRAELSDLAARSGWLFHATDTSHPAGADLLWIYKALERRTT